MADMIIGAIDNLTWDQIKFWANSIKLCGFQGRKVVVALNVDGKTVGKLSEEGFEVVNVGVHNPGVNRWTYQPRQTVHVERFIHLWNFLRKQEFNQDDMVVTTDTRDVVFQHDPIKWADKGLIGDGYFVAGSECIRYKDEPWGRENLLQTFGPAFYDLYKDQEIYNVGVFGGTAQYVTDMCLMIWQMGQNRPIPICDQAVFNFLLWQQPFADKTCFACMSSGWALHCGTVKDPNKIEQFRPHLTEPVDNEYNAIVYLEDQDEVVYGDGQGGNFTPFILHQWDRVPEFRKYVEKKYD